MAYIGIANGFRWVVSDQRMLPSINKVAYYYKRFVRVAASGGHKWNMFNRAAR